MKKFAFFILIATLSFAIEPIVSNKWLAEHLGDKNLVILDVSQPKVYAKGHIPGALNAPIGEWREHYGNYLLVKSPKKIEKLIQRLGIDEAKHVVIYAHHSGKDKLKTSYVAWALELYGIKKSSLLDGGFKKYKNEGLPLSTKIPSSTQSDYTIHFNPSIVIDKKGVFERIGKVRMLDARPAIYYFGAKKQKVLSRAGHIPHATSYFWKYSFNDDGTFKPKKLLQKMLVEGLGLDPTKSVVTYCTGGLETSMNWFVLHRILGFEKARLYDASMKEWANDSNMPMKKFCWE